MKNIKLNILIFYIIVDASFASLLFFETYIYSFKIHVFIQFIIAIICFLLYFYKTKQIFKRKDKELNLYKWLFDMTPAYIFAEDLNGKIIFANSAFKNLFDKYDNIIGLNNLDLYPKKTAIFFDEKHFSVMQDRQVINYQGNLSFDDFSFDYIADNFPLINSKGVVKGLGGIITDVSKLKKSERDLIIARQKAESALEVKSRFISNMSHEIRTPLNGIYGMCKLLSKTQVDCKQKEYIDSLDFSSERLLNLVNDILDFSKIEAGQLELHIENFNLKQMMNNIIFSFKEKVEAKNLKLKLQYNIKNINYFKADPNRIQQILFNLISNSLKFTENGGISIAVDFNNNFLIFSVLDTGIGISEKVQKKLFNDFTQADSSITKKYGGTGLGLSICKKLCKIMKGDIKVESELGKGALFTFNISATKGQEGTKSATMDINHNTINLDKKNILVVDDGDINIQVGKEVIKSLGCFVDCAENGIEAISKIENFEYDAVLMDIQMPVMDGPTALKEIRKNAQFAKLPIIAVTANITPQDKKKYKQDGFNGFIPKPYKKELFIFELDRLINKKDFSESENLDNIEKSIISGINKDKLLELYGDKNLTFEFINDFKKSYKNAIQDIEALHKNNETEKLLKLVHKFKGTAGMVSANLLNKLIEELETIIKENKDGFEKQFEKIKLEWKVIKEDVK